ncbi:MAG: hypothetical protein ACREHG_10285 [Candidatus Saccharimonadales bacterium]
MALVIASFCFVILFGAPYLPTLKKQIDLALDLAEIKPGGVLLELGSGDGRVLLLAAKRGYRAIGYEINPLLVVISKFITWRYRDLVEIRWGNFLTAKWPATGAIFVFGIGRIMPKIDAKIRQAKKPVRLISFAFPVHGQDPLVVKDGLYVYSYHRTIA